MTERRVDPEDGVAYTWEEFSAFYTGKYNKKAIEAYWEECEVKKSKKSKKKAAAKAKAKAEAKPEKAEPKAAPKAQRWKVLKPLITPETDASERRVLATKIIEAKNNESSSASTTPSEGKQTESSKGEADESEDDPVKTPERSELDLGEWTRETSETRDFQVEGSSLAYSISDPIGTSPSTTVPTPAVSEAEAWKKQAMSKDSAGAEALQEKVQLQVELERQKAEDVDLGKLSSSNQNADGGELEAAKRKALEELEQERQFAKEAASECTELKAQAQSTSVKMTEVENQCKTAEEVSHFKTVLGQVYLRLRALQKRLVEDLHMEDTDAGNSRSPPMVAPLQMQNQDDEPFEDIRSVHSSAEEIQTEIAPDHHLRASGERMPASQAVPVGERRPSRDRIPTPFVKEDVADDREVQFSDMVTSVLPGLVPRTTGLHPFGAEVGSRSVHDRLPTPYASAREFQEDASQRPDLPHLLCRSGRTAELASEEAKPDSPERCMEQESHSGSEADGSRRSDSLCFGPSIFQVTGNMDSRKGYLWRGTPRGPRAMLAQVLKAAS